MSTKSSSHIDLSVAIAAKHGLDVALIVGAYVGWCTWSVKNAWLEGHGRFWTKKTPAGLCKMIPIITKERAQAAMEVALSEGLLISTHVEDGGFRIFALGEETIQELPDRLRVLHIAQFLSWKLAEMDKAKGSRAIPVRVPAALTTEALN